MDTPPLTRAEAEAIARQIAHDAIRNHEARFTVSGAALGLLGVVLGLIATGRF